MYPEPGRYTRGRMDPGERTTDTRDEHYDLISVLYHALHGAETIEAYIPDAEAAGDERLAAFFREAQASHRQLAERAKGLLGIGGGVPTPGAAQLGTEIPPEGMSGPETPPRTQPSGMKPGTEEARPRPEEPIARTEEAAPPRPEPSGDLPGTEPPPDEDLIAEMGDIAPDAPAIGEDAAPPAEEPRRAVPSYAPRTQDPLPRTGNAPPSPSEQPPPEEGRPSEEQLPRQGP